MKLLMFLLGVIAGWILFAAGQLFLEKGYERDGIAKINGKHYRIEKIGDETNGKNNG